MGSTFDRRTRPNPCSLFGHISVEERATSPLPVTCCPEAMRMARMSAALGFMELPGTGAPVGYQPSTKYCRMIAAAAAAAGVQVLVPAQSASGSPVPLRQVAAGLP